MSRQLRLDGSDLHLFRIDEALRILREYEPPEGYVLSFSGGKDSCCIKHLADLSGVDYRPEYTVTGADPPELEQFIRDHHPDVKWIYPKRNMFELIAHNVVPPTPGMRYCTWELKVDRKKQRIAVTGVRAQESPRRSTLGERNGHTVHPIINWSLDDVWRFIREEELPYCKLYDEGFKRLGCVGCPMIKKKTRLHTLERWPEFYDKYIEAFEGMLEKRREKGYSITDWKTGEDVMRWWLK